MKINVINPNTCLAMTDKIATSALLVANSETEIMACSPLHGPESIECMRDEVLASAALLDVIAEGEARQVDGHIIACFGDPGCDAAKEIASAPVIGIAQAAFHFASLVSYRFSIVTTLSRTIPMAEHLLAKYGFAHQCASIRAAEIEVLSLEMISDSLFNDLKQECLKAIEEDHCEAIVLGCAGMSDIAARLQAELAIPVIDGVAAAVKLLESLHGLNLKTSKSFIYREPPQKHFTGRYAHWSKS